MAVATTAKSGHTENRNRLIEKGANHILVIVGCAAKKKRLREGMKVPAELLYDSTLFSKCRTVAENHGDHWMIASAQHGLLQPQELIAEYDRTLKGLGRDLIRQWGAWCQADFASHISRHGIPGCIVILAGAAYAKPLKEFTAMRGLDVRTPMEGLGIGKRQRWLKWKSYGWMNNLKAELNAKGN